MISGPAIYGLVLAGGRSSRFGREKALAEIDGRPLIARVAAGLANGCDRVAINAKPSSGAAAWARANGWTLVSDASDDPEGPLAGVKAGLAWAQAAGADRLVTAPCDTPFLPFDLAARLDQALGGSSVAIAWTEHGPEPVCAIWRVETYDAVAQALAQDRHPPLRQVLDGLNAVPVRFEGSAFVNINTPQTHAQAQAQASREDVQITRKSSRTTTITTTSPRPPDG